MNYQNFKKTSLSVAVAGALATGASQAYASAFALIEQNASGVGNAYAGAAAAAEDASTIYYNPAGLSLLPAGKQIVLGANAITPSAKLGNSGSLQSGTGIPGAVPSALRPLQGTGGDAGSLAFVPHAYFAMDVAKDWKFGVGIGAPFGLKTEYSSDWLGRFQGIKSDLQTVNINPTLAYRVNDKVSLGLGLNYQRIDAELTSAVNTVASTFGGVLPAAGAAAAVAAANAIAAANAEGSVAIKGDDSAWGYNFGGMFKLSPQTRLGVSYRSAIKYRVTGTATFSGIPAGLPAGIAAALASGNVSLDIKMPDSLSLALNHQLNSKWTLLADLSWTGWAKINELKILRDNGTTLSNTPENFRNTLRAGFGASYRYNDRWTSKIGIAYDQTPINDTDRTVRLPDSDRTWLAIGAQYRPAKNYAVDLGYTHLFMKDASINQNAGSTAGYGLVSGSYKNAVDILGVQFSYRF
ncbi:MAG: outer membrane protein transport protein [Pseudomonadota bacterium]